ncbi:hypothetical protein BDN72DRAFT_187891 [Pluteus cervinus]|uniref:Uncharacterized protein n=1 Tax=Pluteus cervinus TaxID=181527 RepID=A0ACD3AJ38_9AGAR|nr:hypothetical protein BDN72DRAFT_187891 [Pluteus cervinus]
MDVLKLPAPLLKELDLGARRGGRPLPNDLFAGEFPRLRDLNLTSCQIDFEGPLFKTTNLASLAIISPTTRISMGDMLQMLQKLRRLDSLLLSDALKDDPSSFPPSLSPIHLSKLQLLGLEDCGVSINKGFLTHLALPESTQLHFQCNDIIHAQPLPSLQMAIDAVKQAYGDPDPTFPDIRFDRDVSSHTITLGLMKNRRFGSGEIAPPVIKIVLEFVRPGSRAMLKDLEECMDLWLTGLGRAFLERVEIFHISAQKQEISLDTWSYLGDKLVNLDTLMLGPRIGDSFLRYLATCSTPSTSENPHVDRTEEAYQQSLDPESPDAPLDVRTAEVINQPTSGRMAYMTLRTLNLFCPTLHDVELEALYGALQRRKEEGVGLNELTIHDAAEDLQVLKDKVEASVGFGDSVGEVVWVTVDEV